MISIIVPAHDEGTVIDRSLDHLTRGARAGEIEVLVVCNGCQDDTEARARSFGPPVEVLTTSIPSKALALELGDRHARGFPRFYVDADVLIDMHAVRAVAEVLERGDALAAAPRAFVDLTDASWAVRAYYRVWTALPYFDGSMVGSGVYALSRAGRSRFGEFPEVIADDEFIRMQFHPGERRRVDGCRFTIRPPSRLRGVVREKTRSRLGLYQLERRVPPLGRRQSPLLRLVRSTWALLRRPDTWPSLPLYLLVALWTRRRARLRAALGRFDGWERDSSSRPPRGNGLAGFRVEGASERAR